MFVLKNRFYSFPRKETKITDNIKIEFFSVFQEDDSIDGRRNVHAANCCFWHHMEGNIWNILKIEEKK